MICPVLPTEVTVGTITPDTVELTWTPIPGNLIYRIYYTGPDGVRQETTATTSEAATITGLLPNTAYEIEVVSLTPDGEVAVGSVPTTTSMFHGC